MVLGAARSGGHGTMELLEAHQATRYQRGAPLFQPLSLRLLAGSRLGVVGPNGSGKSTALGLLAGVFPPDEGRVARPPGIRLGYLAQRLDAPPTGTVWSVAAAGLEAVRDAEGRVRAEERRLAMGEPREDELGEALTAFETLGGYAAEAALREVLAAVGFPEATYRTPVAALSGGELRRLLLAAALAGEPEILVLDEPTNHLDLRARAWLATRLARWRGAVVVASHDRSLLDEATSATLFLSDGTWELRRGGYERARRARESELHALRKRDAERAREAERLRELSARLARRRSRGAARRRRAAQRRMQGLASPEPAASPPGTGTAVWRLAGRGASGALLEARSLTVDGVLDVPYLRLEAGARVALLGPNGSGKSTLLALLSASLASEDPRAELRYAPGLRLAAVGQLDRGLQPAVPVLEQVEGAAGGARARALLAAAGVGAARWDEPPEALSGGERVRAGLAALEAREADLLLLDEPTNDLDLEAVEALERALVGTDAAVVLATHDRRLAEAVAEEIWSVETGRLERFANVQAYLTGRPYGRADEALPGGTSRPGPASGPTDGVAPRHGTEHEAAVEALEDERRAIERLLEDPLLLGRREIERLVERRAALDERLGAAYDARLEPPAPRFSLRERGLAFSADRLDDGLLVLAAPPQHAAAAMDLLLRSERGETAGDGLGDLPWPWARVHPAAGVAHVALHEPAAAEVLPWARAALADAAARFAFTLLEVSAMQLFTRSDLPATRLEPAGEGWWTWTRAAFARAEGFSDDTRRTRARSASTRGRARRAGPP